MIWSVQTIVWQLDCLVATKRASKGAMKMRGHVTSPIDLVTKGSLAFATGKRLGTIDASLASGFGVIFLPLTTSKAYARTFDAAFHASTVHIFVFKSKERLK